MYNSEIYNNKQNYHIPA